MSDAVAIAGAGAVSAYGVGWRGLGRAVAAGALPLSPSTELAASHPGVLCSAVGEVPSSLDAGDARSRKLMSRAARLGAIATRAALLDAGFHQGREQIGAWMGVGASGAAMQDAPAILAESVREGTLSLARLGDRGILACNPLFTFQTLNNFSLCHAAILEGLGGPNGAFFSRGAGTAAALAEAMQSLREGSCERALAGGADTAMHPLTWAELVRSGLARDGFVPGEGAAVLALSCDSDRALGFVESVTTVPDGADANALNIPRRADLAVIAPWGAPCRALLSDLLASRCATPRTVDLTRHLGDALAATPALAWVVALDLLSPGESALALSAGPDGCIASVLVRRGDA
jgi:3-oxoacyl-[acyl-carrier-protein] synthase II